MRLPCGTILSVPPICAMPVVSGVGTAEKTIGVGWEKAGTDSGSGMAVAAAGASAAGAGCC